MGLRERLKKLEAEAEGEMLVIPQRNGTVERFPQSAGMDAFMNLMNRMGVGEDAPPEHPLIAAARNSSDPKWTGSFFAVEEPGEWVKPVEDLSE